MGFREVLKKVPREKNVPQRLKPHYEQNICGTAEAVPLSETDFSAPFEAVPLGKLALSAFCLADQYCFLLLLSFLLSFENFKKENGR
jgi:hypothetical protein